MFVQVKVGGRTHWLTVCDGVGQLADLEAGRAALRRARASPKDSASKPSPSAESLTRPAAPPTEHPPLLEPDAPTVPGEPTPATVGEAGGLESVEAPLLVLPPALPGALPVMPVGPPVVPAPTMVVPPGVTVMGASPFVVSVSPLTP